MCSNFGGFRCSPPKLSISTVLEHFYGYWQNTPFSSNMFFSAKWATYWYTKLFSCFEAYLQNMIKTTLLDKEVFSQQNWPYTATLSFSAVLKHFYGIWQKNNSFKKKNFFSQQNEPHPTKLSISTVLKHIYRYWQKHVFFIKKCFSQQNDPHTGTLSFSDVLTHFYGIW